MTVHSRLVPFTLILTAAAMVAVACGPRENAPGSTTSLTTDDVVFLNEVRRGDIDVDTAARTTARGRQTCQSLDHKVTVPEAVAALGKDLPADSASVIVVAAIRHYCPKHLRLLATSPAATPVAARPQPK